LAAGHRRIAFLGDRSEIFTAEERRSGYRAALAEAGVSVDPSLERMGLADSETAHAAALDLLTANERPTAIFAGQNLIAVGAIRALRRLGCQHEIALIGFDDLMLADLLDPGITVIAQDPYALGRQAAELLFSRMDGHEGPGRSVVLPTRLIPRGSGEIPPLRP
jgi:LacI family transcriptional regulator